jgi:hypothetical protein
MRTRMYGGEGGEDRRLSPYPDWHLLADTLLPMELIAAASAITLVEGGWQAAPGLKKKFSYVPLW